MIALRHCGIVVSDLQRSLAFYCDVLGFTVAREMQESGPFIDAVLGFAGTSVRTVKLEGAGTAQIELLAFVSPAPDERPRIKLNRTGPTHIALQVDGLDALYGRMRRAGVRFTTSPQISPDRRAKVTFCTDPDGTWLELVELLSA